MSRKHKGPFLLLKRYKGNDKILTFNITIINSNIQILATSLLEHYLSKCNQKFLRKSEADVDSSHLVTGTRLFCR